MKRYYEYEYCCALGMVPSVENDDVQRTAIIAALQEQGTSI